MSMIENKGSGYILHNGVPVKAESPDLSTRNRTIAYQILNAHAVSRSDGKMKIRFDAMLSHDITYVGVIQTARASGMTEFPLPYALTNCHNSLAAVGGTINEDDHAFGLSAAKKYGGIYVPPNQSVIHQFAREKFAGCGKMILASDSHTRYGCYGTLGVGEGGGELVKQLLDNTWDIEDPEVVLVWMDGKLPHGIGPHDVAIALVGATFPDGLVKNRILEFAGPGIAQMNMDFRIGIDVMTTETSCLTSIWPTDEKVKKYYDLVGRPEDYRPLAAEEGAYYDRMFEVHLDEMESMIALPFHPSNAYTVHDLQERPEEILREVEARCNAVLEGGVTLDLLRNLGSDGKVRCEQGVIVGCSGGMYENIEEAAAILRGKSIGNGFFDLSVYPSSQPVNLALIKSGLAADLIEAGAVLKPPFCGPCFGAGDTPSNHGLSIRHATRNFPSREGSKPSSGQIAAVALMDARSIAATAANGGILTAATDIDYDFDPIPYVYDDSVYAKRCYYGFGKAQKDDPLVYGPNIRDWPVMPHMEKDLLVSLCAVIQDEVTTTDELIPSGEVSSYRSNPYKLAEFALSRRVPEYVGRSQAIRAMEEGREKGSVPQEIQAVLKNIGASAENVSVGSCVFARKPGDGSAREQAASCQKVLGGFANVAYEYATKRYRSNCINWGIVPFTMDPDTDFEFNAGDWLYVPDVREKLLSGVETFEAKILRGDESIPITLMCRGLTREEARILTEGCLMNYYAAGYGK